MTQNQKYHFELVSMKLCPYVQRSVITLKYKKIPFDITYIDLENPPKWFEHDSPLGQVPLLKVNREIVLFESAVINEFLDEVTGAPLLPRDPVAKARERAWIEFGSELFKQNYFMTRATEAKKLEELLVEFFADLERLEKAVSPEGPYFRGKDFGLVDAAYAPLFMRLLLSDVFAVDPRWLKLSRLGRWARALAALPAVKESVVPEFAQLYRDYCRGLGSLLVKG